MEDLNDVIEAVDTSALAEVSTSEVDPKVVARDLVETIQQVERAIEKSTDSIQEIEGRGFFRSAFRSSRKDLVQIANSTPWSKTDGTIRTGASGNYRSPDKNWPRRPGECFKSYSKARKQLKCK